MPETARDLKEDAGDGSLLSHFPEPSLGKATRLLCKELVYITDESSTVLLNTDRGKQ